MSACPKRYEKLPTWKRRVLITSELGAILLELGALGSTEIGARWLSHSPGRVGPGLMPAKSSMVPSRCMVRMQRDAMTCSVGSWGSPLRSFFHHMEAGTANSLSKST